MERVSPRSERCGFEAAGAAAVVAILFVSLVLTPRGALAQQGSRPPSQPTLPPVEVTVTRDAARPTLELPYALSRVVPDSA
jgi:hypothetical protein